MVGLTFQDELSLSSYQFTVIYLNVILSLYCGVKKSKSLRFNAVCFLIYLSLLWSGFHGVKIGIDVKTTWHHIESLSGLPLKGFLSELGFISYLKLQPPIWSWFLSRFPSYQLHQILSFSVGFGLWGLFYFRYGRRISWMIAATPLFQLIIIQPSNDLYTLFFVMLGVVSYEQFNRFIGIILIVFSLYIKHTTLVLLPFLIPVLRFNIVFVMFGIVAYIAWFRSTLSFVYTVQERFYLYQFSFGLINLFPRKSVVESAQVNSLYSMIMVIGWRIKSLSLAALSSLWWYVPLIIKPPVLLILCAFCLIIGYGNVKYLSLCAVLLSRCDKKIENNVDIYSLLYL